MPAWGQAGTQGWGNVTDRATVLELSDEEQLGAGATEDEGANIEGGPEAQKRAPRIRKANPRNTGPNWIN